MQPENRSSFIPKKSIKRLERSRSGRQFYILAYVAYGVFFATILAVAAVFLYVNYLQGQLDATIVALNEQRDAFSQSDIALVKEAERRLRITEHFFNRHVSVYAIFTDLEASVVDSVAFRSFSYVRDDSEFANLTLSARSDALDALAFQYRIAQDTDVLAGAQFTGVNKGGEAGAMDALFAQGSSPTPASTNDDDERTDEEALLPVGFTVQKLIAIEDIPFAASRYAAAVNIPTPPTFDASLGSATSSPVDAGTEGAAPPQGAQSLTDETAL